MPQRPRQPPTAERRGRRRLAGQRAVVTGGSSGVGRAVAIALARRGVHVLATARRVDQLAALAAERLPSPAAPIEVFAGDITLPETRRGLLDRVGQLFGGVDIVVAAAGSGAIGSFRDTGAETLRQIMEIDFFAPAELVRESLPLLDRGNDPAVVLVGSILGYHPLPLHAEYCAAKAALKSLAESLHEELATEGIDVLLASLGPTESGFWGSLVRGQRPAWSRGRALTATATAEAIVDGLERRRREILPGWSAKGFALAARLAPRLIDGVVRRRMRGRA
jgi:short-subunit dehydrogenase